MTSSLWEQRLKGAAIAAAICGLLALLFGVPLLGSVIVAGSTATLWALTTVGPTDSGRRFPRVFASRAHGARPELSRLHTGTDRMLRKLRVLALNRLADLGIDPFDAADTEKARKALGTHAYRLLISGEPPPPRRGDIARCVDAVEGLALLRDQPG